VFVPVIDGNGGSPGRSRSDVAFQLAKGNQSAARPCQGLPGVDPTCCQVITVRRRGTHTRVLRLQRVDPKVSVKAFIRVWPVWAGPMPVAAGRPGRVIDQHLRSGPVPRRSGAGVPGPRQAGHLIGPLALDAGGSHRSGSATPTTRAV
jgi:hypothetical protein